MTSTNQDQIDYWNGEAGARWAANQDALDAALDPLGQAGITRAHPAAGERVLDVGCGCGSTSVTLAAAVGPAGAVVGLDISEPMLARARQRAHGASNATFLCADAAAHGFEAGAGFNLVFSRFGVMFFRDPTAAFANIRTALKPGGRLVFVCWRPRKENPWMSLPFDAATEIVPAGPPPSPEESGPFAFADPERVRRILVGASFSQVEIDPHNSPLVLGPNLDAATEFGVEAGPTARLVAGVDAPTKERVRAAVRSALSPHATATGVVLGSAIWIVSARC